MDCIMHVFEIKKRNHISLLLNSLHELAQLTLVRIFMVVRYSRVNRNSMLKHFNYWLTGYG